VKAPSSVARRLGLAATAMLLSGCAAGQIAQTAQEQPTLDAVHAHVGSIQLTAYLQAPDGVPCYLPGSAVPLALVLVNSGQNPDNLASITSSRFSASTVAANSADAAKVVSSAAGTGSCGGTAAPASPAGGGGNPAGLPQPTSVPTLTAGSSVQLGINDSGQDLSANPVVILEGLQGGPLYPGQSVPMTFTFAKAGSVSVTVPVHLSLVPHDASVPALPSTPGA
jgi:copper(I)-binding protein